MSVLHDHDFHAGANGQAAPVSRHSLATLVREFQAPRQGVLGLIEVLQGRAPSPHQRDCAELVGHSGALLLSIIGDLLGPPSAAFEDPETAPVDFDLRDLIDGLVMIVAPDLRARRLAIRADYPRDVPTLVRGNAARVRQVLLILLSNAVRHTEMGGVTLAVGGWPATGPGRLRLRLSVADTGSGLAPAAGDDGQDLAHARRLVEAMGGDIGVTRTEGQGSTVWFRLDLEPGALQPQPAAPASWLPAPLAILVVDDEAVNRTITAELLRRDGHRVDTADDGAEAVAAVQGSAFDLVLLDIRMDGMDGVEATRRIRALPNPIKARTPIIAMTADATAEDAAACRAAGVTDVVLKPLDKATLAAILKRTLGRQDGQAATATAAPPEDDESLLDLAAVRERVAILGGAMVADIVDRFRSTSEQRLATLDLAWTEGQADPARAQAHAMAGGAGSLGMIGLSRHLNAFENAVRDGRTHDAAALRDGIAALRDRSLAALGRVLDDDSRL